VIVMIIFGSRFAFQSTLELIGCLGVIYSTQIERNASPHEITHAIPCLTFIDA
jgi:hypothetical protein